MATLTIRNLPDDVRDGLRRQAAVHRRSMEAEARAVLQAAVAPKPSEDDRKAAISRLRAVVPLSQRILPEGWSQLDEDVTDGHLEAARENGFISAEEFRTWADRLVRFEVWPADAEAFIAGRVSRK